MIAGAAIGEAKLSYQGSGTVTTEAKRNPKNFLDFRGNLDAAYSSPGTGSFALGGFVKYEADQSFDNSNFVYGGHATWGKYGLFAPNDFLALDFAYGQVDPGEDTERKTALGVAKLDGYSRFDFEALYMLNTGFPVVVQLPPPRLPSGHWRQYRDVLGAAFNNLTPVAVRLGYPEN